MRQPFVAGNWKMYKTVAETRHLVSELVPGMQAISGVEKVLCPPLLLSWQRARCWKELRLGWARRTCTGRTPERIRVRSLRR